MAKPIKAQEKPPTRKGSRFTKRKTNLVLLTMSKAALSQSKGQRRFAFIHFVTYFEFVTRLR